MNPETEDTRCCECGEEDAQNYIDGDGPYCDSCVEDMEEKEAAK